MSRDLVFKMESDRPVPLAWETYALGISSVVNVGHKWIIARNLLELTRLHSDPTGCPVFQRLWRSLSPEAMLVRQQMFAMYTIGATMELTENFAAMCFAYDEAVQHGAKFLPLLLRDFGNTKAMAAYRGTGVNYQLGRADALFERLLQSEDALRRYLACGAEPAPGIAHRRAVISEIVDFRSKYDRWYNQFKHTHSVWPFGALFDVPGVFSILHRIPSHIRWSDRNVAFADRNLFASIVTDESRVLGTKVSRLVSDSFLTAYQNLDDVARILARLEQFWQPIKASQHKALFGTEPPG